MNDQNERQALHKALDSTLSGLQGDPFLYQRVTAQMEKGEQNVKKTRMKTTMVLALAVMLCMATAAMASGWFGGFVNWNGDVIPEEPKCFLPAPTAAPEMSVDMDSFRLAQAQLQTAEEMEIVLVVQTNRFGGTSSYSNKLERHPESYEDFLLLMDAAPELPVPSFIPEGYEYSGCQVVYECKADGAYVLTASDTMEDGSSVRRYRVAEEDAFIRAYSLVFRRNNDAEDYLSVYAGMYPPVAADDYHIGVNEDQSFDVVEVAGMDNALVITGGAYDSTTLTMRRAMPQAIRYRSFDMEQTGRIDKYGEVHVDVRTRQVEAATMVDMFAAK